MASGVGNVMIDVDPLVGGRTSSFADFSSWRVEMMLRFNVTPRHNRTFTAV